MPTKAYAEEDMLCQSVSVWLYLLVMMCTGRQMEEKVIVIVVARLTTHPHPTHRLYFQSQQVHHFDMITVSSCEQGE
jgi:hypothetical protein